jgi:DNA-binding SARP family transcriptional activator/energy-coupling factor transporter ATP-binding protein EcfA2
MTASLRVYLLGRFEVERDGEILPPQSWRRRRPADLLKIVSVAPSRTLHREQAIERLWPDKTLEEGANNLHRALHDLRRVLGGPWVFLDKGILKLDASIWVDVHEFEAAATAGDLASLTRAVELYRGDLCPEDPYGEALESRRQELRECFADAALKLAQGAVERGDFETAIDATRRLLRVDPGEEQAHYVLMRALSGSGRKQDALRQFETCARTLRETLDREPSAPLVAFHRALEKSETSRARVGGPGTWQRAARRLLGTMDPAPLRGRAPALGAIEDFVRHGSGVLFILGESGVGKTRLAVEGARLAQERGALVLSGAGFEFERLAPYALLIEAWSDHLRALESPPEENPFLRFAPESADPQKDQRRLYESVRCSLSTLAEGRPVYWILDDVHLADPSTLQLVHFLARATRSESLMLVATGREEEMPQAAPLQSLLASLYRERLGERLALNRLDREASFEHLADLLEREPEPELAGAVYALAAGNPFYTEEIARALSDPVPPGEVLPLPADLTAMVRERIARLGKNAESLLVAAAVAGERFGFEVARRAAGLPQEEALQALERSLEGRVVEESEGGYRFRHALVREALYRELAAPRRLSLHRAVAESIEAATATSREDEARALASHYQAAELPDRALPYLITAGRQAAARLGMREAVSFFEQARAAMDEIGLPPGPERFALLFGLGQMRVALSDLETAVADLDAAAALKRPQDGWQPSPGERASARRWATLALITVGNLESAREHIEAALEDLSQDPDHPEVAEVHYHLAQLRWHEGRHREAYEAAERCLEAAERHGEPQALARGYEMLALACHSLGEWREGVGFEEQRQSLVGAQVDVAQAFDVHL